MLQAPAESGSVAAGVIATAWGPVGLGWTAHGLTRLLLPDAEGHLGADWSAAPSAQAALPAALRPSIALLQRYFSGEAVGLAGTPIDFAGVPDFHRRIYIEMLRLGWGETVTYGELAARVGSPGAARAVGQAMQRNALPVVIPCHRVLASGNRMGGFSAPGGTATKRRLLAMEGVQIGPAPSAQLDFSF